MFGDLLFDAVLQMNRWLVSNKRQYLHHFSQGSLRRIKNNEDFLALKIYLGLGNARLNAMQIFQQKNTRSAMHLWQLKCHIRLLFATKLNQSLSRLRVV